MVAFITRIRSNIDVYNDGDISDDRLSDDDLAKASKILCLKWIEEFKASKKENTKKNMKF